MMIISRRPFSCVIYHPSVYVMKSLTSSLSTFLLIESQVKLVVNNSDSDWCRIIKTVYWVTFRIVFLELSSVIIDLDCVERESLALIVIRLLMRCWKLYKKYLQHDGDSLIRTEVCVSCRWHVLDTQLSTNKLQNRRKHCTVWHPVTFGYC